MKQTTTHGPSNETKLQRIYQVTKQTTTHLPSN